MPDFFHFDELTWPEVAALPRDTPLLLPLGSMPDSGYYPLRLLENDPTHRHSPSHSLRLGRERAGGTGAGLHCTGA